MASATTTKPRSAELRKRSEARLTTESRPGFKTTEFFVMAGTIIATLIAAAAVSGPDIGPDPFTARQAWLYVAIVAGAYIVSRGLAKSGTSEPYWEQGPSRASGNGK